MWASQARLRCQSRRQPPLKHALRKAIKKQKQKNLEYGKQKDLTPHPSYSPNSCVTLGKTLNLSEPQFPHLSRGGGIISA